MKVLIVGGGGRENAMAWLVKKRNPSAELYCAPGNPGMAEYGDLVPIPDDEVQKLADFATDMQIDVTIVGPELPLSLGIVDEFSGRGLACFGPTRDAARLESSKVFAKEFMQRHGVPTADFEVAFDRTQAEKAAKKIGLPCVLKADGLAAGKGVLIVRDRAELQAGLDVFFEEKRFGVSGAQVLVEPFLRGEEVSFIGICDGARLLPMATSKDYKRIGDNDTGPNTGGMGAHSPAGIVNRDEAKVILTDVMQRTLEGMASEGTPFRGFLYAGIMMTHDGPQVLEYNVRLGDPEAQALLMRLDDDLAGVLRAGAQGDFGTDRLHFKREASACLVLASEGYPESPKKGEVIEGIDAARQVEGVEVFHAGTATRDGDVIADGGRVINVCATGADLRQALRRAYSAAGHVQWPSKVLRNDIGRRVLESQFQDSGTLQLPSVRASGD